MIKRIFAFIISTCISFSISYTQEFIPNTLQLDTDEVIPYSFDGSTLEIPVRVTGTPSSTIFCVFTNGKGADIGSVRNGYLGWHYVNNIDTCIYFSQPTPLSIGDGIISWDGMNQDGEIVEPGVYTYYLWGYDDINEKVKATSEDIKIGWNCNNVILQDHLGNVLGQPYFVSITSEINAESAQRKKWIIGYDPEDGSLVETTSYVAIPETSERCKLQMSRTEEGMFYIAKYGNSDHTTHVMKYQWIPNGESILQTDWGVSGQIAFNNIVNDGWDAYIQDLELVGDNALFVTNTTHYGESEIAELVWIDAEKGLEVGRIDLSEWWIRPVDEKADGQKSSGPNTLDVVAGNLYLGAHSSCLNQMITPLEGANVQEMTRWINSNGDFIGDHNWEEDSSKPWVCHDFNAGPYKYHFESDANGFSVFPTFDLGAVSFGLYAPDGTGINYLSFAAENDDLKRDTLFIQTGTAYDGIYTDNTSLRGENNHNGYWFVAHDSKKGLIAGAGDIRYVRIKSPNGGERWITGSTHEITWHTISVESICIEYSSDGGDTWQLIVDGVDASAGSYQWTLPGDLTDNCVVRVTASDDGSLSDTSNGTFTVSYPFVRIISPNGGERWAGDSIYTVRWNVLGCNIGTLSFSYDGGTNWTVANDAVDLSRGFVKWHTPNIVSDNCLISLTDNHDQSITDSSDAPFSLTEAYLMILSPNGNEELFTSDYTIIIWESHGFDTIDISFSVDGGESWNLLKNGYNANIGEYSWDPPNINTRECLIRICSTTDSAKEDVSDDVFVLVNNVQTDVDEVLPEEFTVYQNSPNPFNPSTNISFMLPDGDYTEVQIFNINGQVVDTIVNEWCDVGRHSVTWDASNQAAGMYFYRVSSGVNAKVMKMVLVK